MALDGEEWAYAAHNEPGAIMNDHFIDTLPCTGNLEQHSQGFPKFADLPTEIRCLIWKFASAPCRRLIKIRIIDEDKEQSPPSREQSPNSISSADRSEKPKNRLGNVISAKKYRLHVMTEHRPPRFFEVNRESRQVHMGIYRVHLPSVSGGERMNPCLYLSPELDILHFSTKSMPEIIAEVICDLKAYDPLGIGIQNLCVGSYSLRHLNIPMDSSRLSLETLKVFKRVVAHLKQVFFRDTVDIEARQMFSVLRLRPLYNRSFPLKAAGECFDLVGSDPRPLGRYLRYLTIGIDPRAIHYTWRQMEREFGIEYSGEQPTFQYLISAKPGKPYQGKKRKKISSREAASEYLRSEEEEWREFFAEDGDIWKFGFPNPDTPENLKTAPLTAIGFWLFPIDTLGEPTDAFGRAPTGILSEIHWQKFRTLDYSKNRPHLALYRLEN